MQPVLLFERAGQRVNIWLWELHH